MAKEESLRHDVWLNYVAGNVVHLAENTEAFVASLPKGCACMHSGLETMNWTTITMKVSSSLILCKGRKLCVTVYLARN